MNEHLLNNLNNLDDDYYACEPLRNIRDTVYKGVTTFTTRDIQYDILLDRMLKNCLLHARL